MADASKLSKPPLAVDLDGTLIRADLFTEAMLRLAFAKPWKLPLLLLWLLRGRAYAKAKLAAAFPPDAAALPYDDRLLAWLREERAQGRIIALATASDRRAADAVAAHTGVFDAVFASDGVTNLKAGRKAQALAAAYPQGFCYAGNEGADLKVWCDARQAVLVNASAPLARRAAQRFSVERTFARETGAAQALLRAIRPQHWAKNLLVFLPMLVGQGWANTAAWTAGVLAFAALSCVASAIYLINDAGDIEADRRHPRKRSRPFASGALSPAWGLGVAAGLLLAGFALGAQTAALPLIAVYAAAAGLYSFWMKQIALVDVFVLAALYGLRIVLGGAATGYPASDWLLAFSGFFFLSLALVKRAAEVSALQSDLRGRGYRAGDGPMLKRMGVAAGFVAALVLALYLREPANIARYAAPLFLWALPALVVLWLSRVWLKVDRGEMHDDPLVFAARDPGSWGVLALAVAAFAAATLWPA